MDAQLYSEESVRKLEYHVLARNMVEFQRALGMIERNGLVSNRSYIDALRDALALFEAEMERREAGFDDSEEDIVVRRPGAGAQLKEYAL